MSTSTNINGRARKSLAEQIDRLDSILDGLSENLNDAVAEAVKGAVLAAVPELVCAVVRELLASSALQQPLGDTPAPEATPVPSTPASTVPSPSRRPSLVGTVWAWLRRAAGVVMRCAGRVTQGLRQAVQQFNTYRRPVLFAVGAGAGLALVSWLGVSWQALVGWVTRLVATLAVQGRAVLGRLLMALPALAV